MESDFIGKWKTNKPQSEDVSCILIAQEANPWVCDMAKSTICDISVTRSSSKLKIQYTTQLSSLRYDLHLDGRESKQYHPVFKQLLCSITLKSPTSLTLTERIPDEWIQTTEWMLSDDNQRVVMDIEVHTMKGKHAKSRQICDRVK